MLKSPVNNIALNLNHLVITISKKTTRDAYKTQKTKIFQWNLLIIQTLQQKYPNTEFFLVRIFRHLDWIRRDTPNAGKYGLEKTPYLEKYHAVRLFIFSTSKKNSQHNVSIDLSGLWTGERAQAKQLLTKFSEVFFTNENDVSNVQGFQMKLNQLTTNIPHHIGTIQLIGNTGR